MSLLRQGSLSNTNLNLNITNITKGVSIPPTIRIPRPGAFFARQIVVVSPGTILVRSFLNAGSENDVNMK